VILSSAGFNVPKASKLPWQSRKSKKPNANHTSPLVFAMRQTARREIPRHKMAASNSNFSYELTAELLNIAEVCHRIEHWASKPSPPDSPLIELVKDRVRQLVDAVEYFSVQINHSAGNLQKASAYTHRLRHVMELLRDSLRLLDLCTHQNIDLHGDDGAINAVYASMFLVGHPYEVEGGETVSDEVKKLRLADELTQIISPLFGPHATSRNYRWGLPSAPPPPPSVIATELE
jgi:hypothetical protein